MCRYLKESYLKADPNYDGRVSVPVLWDKKQGTICNNESSEIIRMFNTEFSEFCATQEQKTLDLYPPHLRQQIDDYNGWIQEYGDVQYVSVFAICDHVTCTV